MGLRRYLNQETRLDLLANRLNLSRMIRILRLWVTQRSLNYPLCLILFNLRSVCKSKIEIFQLIVKSTAEKTSPSHHPLYELTLLKVKISRYILVIIREYGRRRGPIDRTYFNVECARRAVQKGGPLQVDETIENRSTIGLKNIDDWALKQNMYR